MPGTAAFAWLWFRACYICTMTRCYSLFGIWFIILCFMRQWMWRLCAMLGRLFWLLLSGTDLFIAWLCNISFTWSWPYYSMVNCIIIIWSFKAKKHKYSSLDFYLCIRQWTMMGMAIHKFCDSFMLSQDSYIVWIYGGYHPQPSASQLSYKAYF